MRGTMQILAGLAAMCLAAAVLGQGAATQPVEPFEQASFAVPQTPVDALVFGRLEKLGIEPAFPCSDAVFLRRVYLDVIGTLPTAQEAEAFLRDKSPDKRAVLIDQLLQRQEYADYWTMKWADVLRIKAEFPIKLWPKAAQAYHAWLHTQLHENRPYDQWVRQLLVSTGSNFYVPEANFYRAVQNREPPALAQAVGLTFMGWRPDSWPKNRLADAAVFFSQVRYKGSGEWKEEIVYLDPANAAALPTRGTLPDGRSVAIPPDGDARAVFADWLIAADNPYFARAAVNRIWCWLMGRGIVHEADDFRPDNPPANPALLDYLAREFVAHKYDLKHVFRLILSSRTYQLSSIPRSKDERAAANFAHYTMRRLDAEVLVDAMCQITGVPERYSSAVPEPFTYLPRGTRAICIADGNTTSAVLELFGRPSRDTGLMSERNDTISAAQRLHLLNSSHVQNKITSSPKLRGLSQGRSDPSQAVRTIYLTVLSRYPTPRELEKAAAYGAANKLGRGDLVTDTVWALFNSDEFLFRH